MDRQVRSGEAAEGDGDMGNMAIIAQEISSMQLGGLGFDAEGAASRALAKPLAKALVERLEAKGVEASWAPDNDDKSLAWVYVTVEV